MLATDNLSKAVHLRNNETCNLTNGGCDAKLHSLLSIGQLAAVLGVSVSTVRRWCREGRLKELAHGRQPSPLCSLRLQAPAQ
ncbi:helix-turn-helix domain-containing protein [Duodenibacillus massiliensis]|uniref:helix-turn-helix domain-containing protein n=1 Tax=Duodenibacillus massiliensis TaxID=1852381 RepID=UPI003F82115C